MREMTVEQATDMMLHVCDAIIGQKQYLAEVDSRIGDGDHGAGMAGGMEKAKAALEAKRPFPDINTIFRTMGMEMIGSMGGASGVIFGSMFMGGARDVPSAQILDSDILAKMMRASLDAVKHRGKAQLGDKTMVDALEPAVLALERQACAELEESLIAAALAAEEGVEKTKDYVAKFGRAKFLGERTLGYEDAGAVSVRVIFQTMKEYAEVQ